MPLQSADVHEPRSEPLGFADDQITNAANGRRDDTGTAVANRNVTSGGGNRVISVCVL